MRLLFLLTGARAFSQPFQEWKTKHGITYEDAEQFEERFAVWTSNDVDIQAHNDADEHTFTLGHNQFSDLTSEEFAYLHLGGYAHRPGLLSMLEGRVYWPEKNGSVDAIDWRDHGIVGAVRNQGQCGSCWAHAAVETIESLVAQKTEKLVELSVQSLVSCDKVDSGCSGGLPDNAYTFVRRHGLPAEDNYPYTSGSGGDDGSCHDTSVYAVSPATVTGFKDVPQNDEEVLRSVISEHPVSVAVDATKWQFYHGGVFNHEDCGKRLNHAVQIVGYNQDGKYYIVRNSWGTTYGEDGYIRVVMDHDMCGISQSASFPTIAEEEHGSENSEEESVEATGWWDWFWWDWFGVGDEDDRLFWTVTTEYEEPVLLHGYEKPLVDAF